MCPPATKGRAWYPPWWALLAPEPGVKGSPPLSVKTSSAASLLRLLYSLSCLPAREDEVTCKCVALVSKSGSLWPAKGCNVVSVSTGWGLFRYLTLLLQLLHIQAAFDLMVIWKFKKGTHLFPVDVRSDHRWFIYDITYDKPMFFYPYIDMNVINTDTNVVFGKNVDDINVLREVIFTLISLFSLFKKLSQFSWFCFSGTKVMLVFSNTWTLHAEGSVNLWPVTTEQHESHSSRTETRFITAW